MEKLRDLSQNVQEFCSLAGSLQDLRKNVQRDQTASSDPTSLQLRLAEEYVGLGSKKKALTVVKNLLVLGFAISVMMKVRSCWLIRRSSTVNTS